TWLAFRVGDAAIGVEAWARRASLEGGYLPLLDPLEGLDLVKAIAEGPSSTKFARAVLYDNIGLLEMAKDHRAFARISFERALIESRGVRGPGTIELLSIQRDCALVTDDPATRESLLADAEKRLADLLGEDHPETLEARWTRAVMTIPLARATKVLS